MEESSVLIYTILLSTVLLIYVAASLYVLWSLKFKLRSYEYTALLLYFLCFLVKSLSWVVELANADYKAYIGVFILIDVSTDFLININLYLFISEMLDVYYKLRSETFLKYMKYKKYVQIFTLFMITLSNLVMILAFAVTSWYFLQVKLKNQNDQKINLSRFNKFIIGWVIFLLIYNLVYTVEKCIRPPHFMLAHSQGEEVLDNVYIERFIVYTMSNLCTSVTLLYLFYHQGKIRRVKIRALEVEIVAEMMSKSLIKQQQMTTANFDEKADPRVSTSNDNHSQNYSNRNHTNTSINSSKKRSELMQSHSDTSTLKSFIMDQIQNYQSKLQNYRNFKDRIFL
ncbi:UNKNOWN [Stylonychia lemnae]|uniref:Uncharacterized protein n=1 Tax=Stylonychia lemnae TaxID=5949 RepID=A0A078BCY9_STYLE|nr:UNKNOWN [Stylonychia lemnae]|eukprot:CDW91458.1 UNKNOWN [Stylonychia lemnae]